MTTFVSAGSDVQPLVVPFGEGDRSMADLLGGKGANLAEMTRLGLPVPHGFVITTQACRDYLRLGHPPVQLEPSSSSRSPSWSASPDGGSATRRIPSSSRCAPGPAARCPA